MKNKYLWLVVLLCAQIFAVRAVSYDAQVTAEQGLAAVSKIPHTFADWKGTDYPLEPRIYDILETRSIIHRSYENSVGKKVFLSIVYYAETKVNFHAPESCLGGQGINTLKVPDSVFIDKLKTMLTVSKLVQQNKQGKSDLVYYFFKAGPFMGRSFLKLRLNLVINKFKDIPKSGSLIRVSTQMDNNLNQDQASDLLKVFINDLNPYIIKYL
jgi:EpsI family protein